MTRLAKILLALFVLAGLSACAASKTPQMIASFPADPGNAPLTAPAPPQSQLVYNTSLELQVDNLEEAAQRAKGLAERYGGYLSGWNSWRQNDELRMQLTLEVPAPNFSALRADLLKLGEVAVESANVQWDPGRYGWDVYSEIYLVLRPSPSPWPRIEWPSLAWPGEWFNGWNPGNTFRQASGVFWGIFGFLVDILIWLLVVAGPFVLLALGARWVYRRLRR